MKWRLNMLREIFILNQNNEYFVNLDKNELLNKNVIVAENINGKLAILIKDLDSNPTSNYFSTDYLLLKTCSKIYLNNEYIGIYHIIICLSNESCIVNDFKNVFEILILKNSKRMTSFDVLNLFNSIDLIFKTTEEKENRELQIGLFGELITLKYLYNLGNVNIIDKWHTNFSLKHDIELDKLNRIEIKTTTSEKRIHTFKHNQLTRRDVKVFVVSCLLEISQIGLSLNELINEIIDLCCDINKINELQALKKKCGINNENNGLIFNEKLAYFNLKLYDSNDIPQIKENIPESITKISYDVDLTNVSNIDFEILKKMIY